MFPSHDRGASGDLGAGFGVTIRNSGTGIITITPDGSETIDGRTDLSISENQTVTVLSDGSNLGTTQGGGWAFIEKLTASNVTEIEFTNISAAFTNYVFIFSEIVGASDGEFRAQTSNTGGSPYDSGASDYGQGATGTTGSNTTHYTITVSTGTGTETADGVIWLINPSDTSNWTKMFSTSASINSSGVSRHDVRSAVRREASNVDAIRFYISTSNISGEIEVWGLRGQ